MLRLQATAEPLQRVHCPCPITLQTYLVKKSLITAAYTLNNPGEELESLVWTESKDLQRRMNEVYVSGGKIVVPSKGAQHASGTPVPVHKPTPIRPSTLSLATAPQNPCPGAESF